MKSPVVATLTLTDFLARREKSLAANYDDDKLVGEKPEWESRGPSKKTIRSSFQENVCLQKTS